MATITIRLDDNLKNIFAKTCEELGLDMSTAITIFAKKMSREKRIPFDVSIDPFYSESNIKYLEQKMQDYKAGKLQFADHELIEEQ